MARRSGFRVTPAPAMTDVEVLAFRARIRNDLRAMSEVLARHDLQIDRVSEATVSPYERAALRAVYAVALLAADQFEPRGAGI